MKNHLIKITKTRHTLCIMNYTLCIVFSALCIILTSCGNPSAGSGVPVFFTDAKVVSAGSSHTVAIKNDGTLWAWGGNYRGQLGDGTTRSSNTSIRIGTDNDWLTVSAGSDYTVAIKTDGSLWTWGANYRYQLGDTKISNPKIPNNIGDGWRVVSADKSHYEGLSHSTGSYHTIAIKRDGVLWSWGYNEFGSLGDASTKSNPIPTRVIESDW